MQLLENVTKNPVMLQNAGLHSEWLVSSWFQDGCFTSSHCVSVPGTIKAENQVSSPPGLPPALMAVE